jgi:hypothetical protein
LAISGTRDAAAGGNATLMTLADEWQPTKSQLMD